MTDADLKRARELVDAATPGPWKQHIDDKCLPSRIVLGADAMVADCAVCLDGRAFQNAAFIAASRTLVGQLLDEVEACRGRLALFPHNKHPGDADCWNGLLDQLGVLKAERDSLRAQLDAMRAPIADLRSLVVSDMQFSRAEVVRILDRLLGVRP